MTRTLLTYRVSGVNAKEHIQLTTQQRSGADAAAYARASTHGPARRQHPVRLRPCLS